jgi:hypothetical protein
MPLPAPTTIAIFRLNSFSAGIALQLGLLERPVLDAEGLTARQRYIVMETPETVALLRMPACQNVGASSSRSSSAFAPAIT